MKGIGRVPWREACTELRQSRVETFLKWFCFMTVLSGVFTPLQGAVFCRVSLTTHYAPIGASGCSKDGTSVYADGFNVSM